MCNNNVSISIMASVSIINNGVSIWHGMAIMASASENSVISANNENVNVMYGVINNNNIYHQ
jgi:hypothetical protein